ncbi:MAG: ATP-binding cassette domain-containing protein [Candidatus Omnitrophica bacterium]|nr:ATP-binding cassette domain-containing protein [Candidatus Omnitrophota bacterium]
MTASSPTQYGVDVQVRGLQKSYAGQPVLQGIDLEVAAGEIFVIMGPSGSGKSVLLKHIAGLETPDAGEILIAGHPIKSAGSLNHYRLAMVFQSGALLNSLSVGENVGLYLSEHRIKPQAEIDRIVKQTLEQVGLKGIENRNPAEISGGMKKRVAIARALVTEPQLILYDEPTSELDPLIAVTITEEILRLKRQFSVTSMIVTHDRSLAFGVADRIAMISDGRILFVGLPGEVKANPNPMIQKFLTAKFDQEKERKTI